MTATGNRAGGLLRVGALTAAGNRPRALLLVGALTAAGNLARALLLVGALTAAGNLARALLLVGGLTAAGNLARALLLVGTLLATPLSAHEYWFDPIDATPAGGEPLLVHVRNGVDFAGTSYPYNPKRMSRLELVDAQGQVSPLSPRLGDLPAVQVSLERDGYHLLVLDTFGKSLDYDDLAAFEKFLRYHGLGEILKEHGRRDLPDAAIREVYFRHVKSLIRAGDDIGEVDLSAAPFAAQGQRLELVPLSDPYTSGALRLRLLLDEAPVVGAQVEMFERAHGVSSASRLVRQTNSDGDVEFDVGRPGDYLVNAVQVLEPGPEALALPGRSPHWESRWSSLTFERP